MQITAIPERMYAWYEAKIAALHRELAIHTDAVRQLHDQNVELAAQNAALQAQVKQPELIHTGAADQLRAELDREGAPTNLPGILVK